MQIIGPPPALTARATEQIRTLGTDSAHGFQQLRRIGRTSRKLVGLLTAARNEKFQLERKQEELAPYPSKRSTVDELAARLSVLNAEIRQHQAELDRLAREEDAVHNWHAPVARMLHAVLKELGFTSVEQVLPYFDDGVSAEVDSAVDHFMGELGR